MKIVRALHGLGDSIYQRPLVAALAAKEDNVFLETPLPLFYSGIPNLKFLKIVSPWRTQKKSQASIPESLWSQLPEEAFQNIVYPHIRPGYPRPHFQQHQRIIKPELEVKFSYGPDNYSRFNLIGCLERQAKVVLPDPIEFDMPDFGPCPVDSGGKPIAVIRPPTDRLEWLTPARQCLPEYTNQASKMLRAAGFYVVSVADCVQGQEWLVGQAPEVDAAFLHGELPIPKLMALCQHAKVIVGGVGWIFPAGIAFKKWLFIVFGGRGGYDSIHKISDLRMDTEKLSYAEPDSFCQCTDGRHNCNKTISNFGDKFQAFLNKVD